MLFKVSAFEWFMKKSGWISQNGANVSAFQFQMKVSLLILSGTSKQDKGMGVGVAIHVGKNFLTTDKYSKLLVSEQKTLLF